MKHNIEKKNILSVLVMVLMISSCMQETLPTSSVTPEQIGNSEAAQEGLLNGIVAKMIDYDSYGASSTEGYDYRNDFGYPCQMIYREVQGEDFPVYNSDYSYWYRVEAGTDLLSAATYTFTYYYQLIKSANDLISTISGKESSATATSLHYYGAALAFRAMAYLDMARMFEFQKTGIASLDAVATSYNCWGLTVPIVDERKTLDELKNNPRVDFTTMYRFILTDLNKSEQYIKGYVRSDKTKPDMSVVDGLMARFWLELATRFERSPEDLAKMVAADQVSNGYDRVGVTSAMECYQKARDYAVKAENSGYTPVSKLQWQNNKTGFNKVNDGWMWCMSFSTKEQLPTYYFSYPGTLINEANWSMGRCYNAYRMCGSYLYSQIGKGDWRRDSWVDPESDSTSVGYQKYVSTSVNTPLLTETEFKKLPAYTNLKFRPADGGMDDNQIGCLVDIPLMRVEEMYFIEFECTAHINSVAIALSAMKKFINDNRYTDNSYNPTAPDITEFNSQLMLQKRIEFWGEGLTYFDYKRLRLPILRKKNVDPKHKNYESAFLINSREGGYVAPWMNYYITAYEGNVNTAIIPNPDTSGYLTKDNSY